MKRARLNLKQKKDRAVILVLVLWIVVILSLMAYSMLYQVSSETSITSVRKKQLKAEALARAGIAKAIVDLRNDSLFDSVEGQKNFDGEGDVWARPEEGKLEAKVGDDKEGYFDARVYDVLSVEASVASRTSYGGTAPANVRARIAALRGA